MIASKFGLSGRGVVVTGAGGHLGRAMVQALAGAGAVVVAMGRSEEPLAAAVQSADGQEGRAVACVGDVSAPDDVRKAIETTRAEGVPLCGWVNNAYHDTPSRIGHLDRTAVERSISAGLVDSMMIIDQVAPAMVADGRGGSIVNVASMYALVSPDPSAYAGHPDYHNPPAYGAAKAGLLQHTRYAAVHLAKRGIRVNALSPGAFPGPAVQADSRFIDALAARAPMGRIGQPEEIGGGVVFLISDASSFMTGQNLVIDGGWTAW